LLKFGIGILQPLVGIGQFLGACFNDFFDLMPRKHLISDVDRNCEYANDMPFAIAIRFVYKILVDDFGLSKTHKRHRMFLRRKSLAGLVHMIEHFLKALLPRIG
jgi:hypothetical protein